MANIIETELAWMAGFFDGEGSIMLGAYLQDNGNHHFKRRICVVNTNTEVLKVFQRCFGGSIHRRRCLEKREDFKNSKPTYEWALHSKDSAYFIGEMIPYLKLKKCQADLFMDYDHWLNSCPIWGRKGANKNEKTRESLDARLYLVETMHKLNKRGKSG